MYKSFFDELLFKLKNFDIQNLIVDCKPWEEVNFTLISNGIKDFTINLEKMVKLKKDFVEFEFENNIGNRKILTALQAIFGGFTGENLRKNQNHDEIFETSCALIMLTKTICSPFYLSFLEENKKKIEFINQNLQKNIHENDNSCNLISKFLFLRSSAILGFLKINGNFINLFQNDYKNLEFYQNIDEKINSFQKKYEKNLIYKQTIIDFNENNLENNAFYVIHRKRKIKINNNGEGDVIFIINVENSQISSNFQKEKSKIRIYSIDLKNLNSNEFYLNLSKFLINNQVNLNEILKI